MEDLLDARLDDVRVHRNVAGGDERSARTFGPNVVLPTSPTSGLAGGTPLEEALLAHELAHVIHQRSPAAGRPEGADPASLEAEAEAAAAGSLAQTLDLDWLRGFSRSAVIPRLRAGLKVQHCSTSLARIPDPAKVPSYQEWLKGFPPLNNPGLRDITSAAPEDLRKLIGGKFGVPPDCADVSLLLRHYYLKAQGQTLSFRAGPGQGQQITIGAGVTDGQISQAMINLGSINFQEDRRGFRLVQFYKAGGTRIRNLKSLVAAGLGPGDVLVWKRLSSVAGNFEGHVQTVQAISLGPSPTLTVVQGNMQAGVGVGQLQQKQISFLTMTGAVDGDADILSGAEEEFFGAGPWTP